MKHFLPTALLGLILTATPAFAQTPKAGDWMMRVRAIDVSPDESSHTSINGQIAASSTLAPELDFSYFWSENWASELILATTKHEMKAKNTNSGGLDLGDVWILPPTLTMQYHFTTQSPWKPYLGAGINYTIFYNEDAAPQTSISYKNGFGYALQAGMDYNLNDKWVLNADVKKIFLNTKATVNGTVHADVDLDPWVFGLGVGYRF